MQRGVGYVVHLSVDDDVKHALMPQEPFVGIRCAPITKPFKREFFDFLQPPFQLPDPLLLGSIARLERGDVLGGGVAERYPRTARRGTGRRLERYPSLS